MKSCESLKEQIRALDGQDYTAYQSLRGGWAFPHFELVMQRIPKDPYAPPATGVYRAIVPRGRAGFRSIDTASRTREVALRDFLARNFHEQCARINGGRRGTGNSGIITIAEPGQSVLERTSIFIDENVIEARFFLGLPAAGRAILSDIAAKMLFEELPRIVQASLFAESLDLHALEKHLSTTEDAAFLREFLSSAGLVAFIADGSVLPRLSGVEQKPLETPSVVAFRSPERLRASFDLPNAGCITGMGIPKGVTILVGGGYHGKSTVLQALELGIYDHTPGDGREFCVTHPAAVKVRASSGRRVANTDVSAFIDNIPTGQAATSFSTENASGSTSQAAFIAEAIESGAKVLLMDEDTCAANFMIRDKRMQELVAKEHEPITAFVDRVRVLYEEHDISTILVMGGSGDYFSVADCVIQMIDFAPRDVTRQAHAIAARFPTGRAREGSGSFKSPRGRIPLGDGLDPHNEYGQFRIQAATPRQIVFGRTTIDLFDVDQIVETAQTRAIGRAILHARQYMSGSNELAQIVSQVMEDVRRDGLDVLDSQITGDFAQFRGLELAAALNRMRGLEVKQAP